MVEWLVELAGAKGWWLHDHSDGTSSTYLGTAVVVHVFCTALGKKPETLTHACTRVKRTCILTRMDLSVCSILAKTISVRSTAESSVVRMFHLARS